MQMKFEKLDGLVNAIRVLAVLEIISATILGGVIVEKTDIAFGISIIAGGVISLIFLLAFAGILRTLIDIRSILAENNNITSSNKVEENILEETGKVECSNCGGTNLSTSKYCEHCGAKI